MSWHRNIANRATSALLGSLMDGTVISDGQTGFRAFSTRALQAAEIRHDYNYAQVLTLSLWGAGIEPVEVPISYRRRTNGRSFVRYPEYFARVAPSLWRQWRASKIKRATSAQPIPTASAYGHASSAKNGNSSVSGPNGASGRSSAKLPPAAHVEVEPDRAGHGQQRQRRAHARHVAKAPGHERDRQRQPGQQVPRREPEAEHRGGEEGGHEQLHAQRRRAQRRRHLDPPHLRHGACHPLAVGVPQQPHAGEREHEHRRPAKQAVVAVDEQRHEPVAPLEVAEREAGVGGGSRPRCRPSRGWGRRRSSR